MVSKFGKVDIVAKIENLRVKASGKALQDGYKDDIIRVENINTKQKIDAVVLSENEVEVVAF